MPPPYHCSFCNASFQTPGQIVRHQAQKRTCRERRQRERRELAAKAAADQLTSDDVPEAPVVYEDETTGPPGDDAMAMDTTLDTHQDMAYPDENNDTAMAAAGACFDEAATLFESIRDDQVLEGCEVLGPFADDDEWELAKWLIKNVGHNAADDLLRLPIMRKRAMPSYSNKNDFLATIDQLPQGPEWKLETITLTGDQADEDGSLQTEDLELWYRDPVECIRELMGNPLFRDALCYEPGREFEQRPHGLEEESVNEMWTGAWWWKIQERLPKGATVAPVILASDKTMLSQFRGDQSAWPVYLSIGNISKDVRREVSSHATVLVGYLPIGKFQCFKESSRQAARYRTFHHCMSVVLAALAEAGTRGEDMTCADGFVRWIFPILACYVADYPEQCLVSCCMESRCPICKISANQRGDHKTGDARTTAETTILLAAKQAGRDEPELKQAYTDFGIRPVFQPFWMDLPHCDIFHAFTPDLLHQLHKGVFKDHLVKWCTALIGVLELDARFKAMPLLATLKHFKNGISGVSQWTGHEHKAMEKVFVGLMVNSHTDPRVISAVRGALDFIYYASLRSHTRSTLASLALALDVLHDNKQVFIDYEARDAPHFNIPKFHMLEHYVELIWAFGSADGFNTETPERLHIDYAKNAYRASNRKDYVVQMTTWLRRQEAVDRFTSYLNFSRNGLSAPLVVAAAELNPSTRVLATFAKHHPPDLRHVAAQDLILWNNAPCFIPAVQTYITDQGSPLTVRPIDAFGLYKRIVIKLPIIREAGSTPKDLTNTVYAAPPVRATGRHPATPAQLDFALIRTGDINPQTTGTSLQGLRVGRVRSLFSLPVVYQLPHARPLAYVEWYTALGPQDDTSGLYHVRLSTRNQHPNAEVIESDRIVRNCYLIPHFSRTVNPAWTSANSVDHASLLYLNAYSDLHMYSLLKLKHDVHGVL
ncbi:hypothetical protein GGF50DRAFT_129833 [Schizophyllum commune]